MTRTTLSNSFLAAAAAAALMIAPACGRNAGEKEVKDLSQKAAELETLNQKAGTASAEEQKKLAQAGVTNVAPNPDTLELTPEQKTALEARIKVEKNSSYQALLQEVLDKDKEIKGLNEKIGHLRAVLPRPEIAKADDTHYDMAMRYLRKRGVPEAKAKELVAKVLTMDQLAPGFHVYHFYSNGVYGSWVAQGKADLSPTQLQADRKARIEGERDQAEARSKELQAHIVDLTAQSEKLTADIESMRTEKERMTKDLQVLTAASQTQQALLNSVHYLVGRRKVLEDEGIIVVPVFSKDRAGSNWNDQAFTKTADLRSQDSITITAADAGLEKINKINVVPGSLVKDKHYTLAFNPDHTQATVKLLAKDRFRNEKVVFAVTD
ncbi:hypothetical protein [Mesoterricola silvestris]|uniref:Lipoprotein n=1 Tax=Mesoterricola silvestris TaxID=2927979 RepID=A0AA48K801_9BACT|nr:hypothetical protein [Mesoterricola silvestris]BDU72439.1 hypothetical protein METEAL_16130 [Mesoterricola silvestris]